MKRGELYWVRLDPVEGSEQAGTRPAVVVSRNAINQHSPVVVVCPLTRADNVQRRYPSDVLVHAPEAGLQADSVILTGQIRAIAKDRLRDRLGRLSNASESKVNAALRITLNLR